MKTCSDCGQTKPKSEFRLPDKADYLCKDCNCRRAAAWLAANPGRAKETRRKWRAKNPDWSRRRDLKVKYGMTLEEYRVACAVRDNRCDICHGTSKDGILRVDHDHVTGRVRGLLCDTCNRSLGLLKDSADVLEAAAAYLRNGGTLAVRGVA